MAAEAYSARGAVVPSRNAAFESLMVAVLDHGGDIGPPAPPAVDAVAPAPAPVPHDAPARPPSPVAPPRPPSPIGIGARLPRTKPREWWKLSAAQLDSDIDDDIEDADIAYEVAYSSTSTAEPLVSCMDLTSHLIHV